MELEQGSTDAAKADFDKAVEAAPNDYDIRIDIFCSCSKYGQDDLGKSYLENVLDGDRKRISDFDLGRISYYLGDYEQARTSLEKAQENGGAEAASLLGQTYEHSVITIMRRVSITPTCRTKRRTRLCTISSGFAN